MFNYQNLESGQFERLCRDIIQSKTGTELHVFARGRDGGVDLTDDSDKHNIVVQVKHYEKSGFTALKNNLEKEIEKVKKLNPKQYYICVSQSLTDPNVNTIYQMFSEYMVSTNNILTLDDIDSFLHDPENIQITRNHTNLWLESGTTLQLLLECFPNMQAYLGDADGLPAHQPVYPKCFTSYIPLGPEVGLIGRNDIVDRVRAMLDSDKYVALVSGLGGIGKTAVMAEICNSILSEGGKDTYVAWITCGESYIDDLLTLRQALGIPKELKREEAYEDVVRKLQDLQGTLYLFFDDMARVPDKAELGTYNALRPNMRIMITSRHEIKGIPRVDLKELEKDPAVDMFYDYYGKDTGRKHAADAWEIINSDSVRSHTLLVELLAKAANASFGSLADFRRRIESEGFLKVSRRKFDSGRFDNKTIEESVMQLYEMSHLSPEQQRIMRLFSIFTPEKVIYGAIEEWASFDADAVDGLVKLGWLDRAENGFIIHQIIRDSLAGQVGGCLRIEDYGDLLKRVADTDEYMPRDLKYTEVQERLVLTTDIARYLWSRVEGSLKIEHHPEEYIELLTDSGALFNNMAGVFRAQGDYEKALEYYGKARAINERVSGPEHPDTATTYNNMALVYGAQGEYEKALEYYRKARVILERVSGTEHPDTATTYNNMAGVFRAQGEYEKALEYYGKARIILERVSGTKHPDTATTYNNMALVYGAQGEYEKALEYYGKALAISEQVSGPEHPDTAATYNNMAGVLHAQGHYEKALEYYGKALVIREQVSGPEHPDTATTYNNMAGVYEDQGGYEKALEYYRKALAVRERVSGTEHPDTAATYNNMAGVYKTQGEYDKALEYYGKALVIRERMLGSEHPDTAATYNNMAVVYKMQGEYDKALEYYGKALDILERVSGPEHPDTAATYNNMGGVYYAQGEYDKALEYYGKALVINERVLGSEHPSTVATYNNIVGVYYVQGEYDKALECYGKALTISERVLGSEHPLTATMYNNMAGVFLAQGDYEKALEYYGKVLVIRERVLGPEHPDMATTYNNIAGVYEGQGEYDKSLEYCGKALAINERVLGPEHPDTATAYNNMAGVYEDQGEYDKALECYGKALAINERVLGPEHPSTAMTYNNMALVYKAQGEYDKALEYYGKALAISERVLGMGHHSTATMYNNMAGIFRALGDYAEALAYYKKALAVYKMKLGEAHPYTQDTQLSVQIMELLKGTGIDEEQLMALIKRKS